MLGIAMRFDREKDGDSYDECVRAEVDENEIHARRECYSPDMY